MVLQDRDLSVRVNPSMQITVQLDRTYKEAWSLHMEFGRDRTWLQAIYVTRGIEGLKSHYVVFEVSVGYVCRLQHFDEDNIL